MAGVAAAAGKTPWQAATPRKMPAEEEERNVWKGMIEEAVPREGRPRCEAEWGSGLGGQSLRGAGWGKLTGDRCPQSEADVYYKAR